mgnify:CR=1 FL=1
MESKFTVAGTAAQHGVTKVRFANDLVSRIKILVKNNCENINLITEKLYEKNKDAKRGEYKKPISIAEIRSRKVDVTPTSILEQTGFAELDTSELDVN